MIEKRFEKSKEERKLIREINQLLVTVEKWEAHLR